MLAKKIVILTIISSVFCSACQAINSQTTTRQTTIHSSVTTQFDNKKIVKENNTSLVSQQPLQQIHPIHKKAGAVMISAKGTVTYINLEGGFYGIITEKGRKLLPLNLDKAYQQAGAEVKITAQLLKNRMTIQQWGTPVTITDISLIKAANSRSEK